MKKFLSLVLSLFFASNSAFAIENFTYTIVEEEQYSASSPIGHFENYQNSEQIIPVNNINGMQNTVYVAQSPVSANVQDIEVPQSYNKRKVVTESRRDERETADKVVDRFGKVAGPLALLGLVSMGIIGIVGAVF